MASERKPTRTETNLYSAIIGEGLAHLRYHAFAIKALEEGHPEVAQIFLEVAGAETVHGLQHLRVSGEIKATAENLRGVVEGEAYEFETMYPSMIREAEAEGRPDAVASFRLAMERERYHLSLFAQALEGLQAKLRAQGTAPAAPTPAPAAPAPAPLAARPPAAVARENVERERWRVAALTRVREMVFGAQDGLLSTVALVTSMMVALNNSNTVVIAGLAGALAGALSMATGAFLGSRAEREVEVAEIGKEARELRENPAEELAELIAIYQREGMSAQEARTLAERIASDRELWLKTLVEKELGLSAEPTGSPAKDALVMGASFIVAAIIPILPYFFVSEKWTAIGISVAAALAGLFGLGILKARLIGRPIWLSALEILGIGIASAGVGYVLGDVIPRIVGR
ncbi:MAG: VIT1/CCC1 transporter family protein [Chloroflexi bacterium]|nr:VIT1/CCC1 transporter family protein [Chloroflexota bacterium]